MDMLIMMAAWMDINVILTFNFLYKSTFTFVKLQKL